MTKHLKILFCSLIVLIALLAASNGFFLAKNRKLGPTPKPSLKVSVLSSQTSNQPEIQASSTAKLTSSDERPSDPADTYTIKKGDSLLGIAQENGLTTEELISANGLSDPDKILSGQVLIIPKSNQINFTIDNDKAVILQKYVDNGKYPWRLSPEETASSDNAGVYDLSPMDNFTLKDKNTTEGQATVIVNKDGKNYQIRLVQPVTKGEKGIWAIISIGPIK